MYRIHLYQRLTFKYAPGWKSLDSDRFVCTAKVLAPSRDGFDSGENWVQTFRVVVPRGADPVAVEAAIHNEFTDSGCWNTYVRRVIRAKRREYVVTTVSYQNY